MVKKWMPLVCLCLFLTALPLFLTACPLFNSGGKSATYAPNGSVQFPYSLETTKGKCTAWSVVLDSGAGATLCASSLPTQHVGQYVQVSIGGFSQNMSIVSVDAQKKVVHLE